MKTQKLSSFHLPPKLKPFHRAIKKIALNYLQISITPNITNWWQSKFGGFPYFPKNMTYPTNENNEYLSLIAQINFAEITTLKNFPKTGILQFYIDGNDELYGLDYDQPTQQKNFRILYFPKVDKNISNLITNFDFLPKINEDYCYIIGEFSLNFKSSIAPINPFDKYFPEKLPQLHQKDNNSLIDLYEEFYNNNFEEVGHKLGGYPEFIQGDPRSGLAKNDEPYELLLQIDSQFFDDGKYICWGDAGICNFFIQPSMLKKLDFSKVLYNWDCS